MRNVAIVGAGMTPFAEHFELGIKDLVPMAYAASRAWKIQWDRFVIPKPLARIVIVVGEPVYVAKGLDAAGLGSLQLQMEARLKALYAQAAAAI